MCLLHHHPAREPGLSHIVSSTVEQAPTKEQTMYNNKAPTAPIPAAARHSRPASRFVEHVPAPTSSHSRPTSRFVEHIPAPTSSNLPTSPLVPVARTPAPTASNVPLVEEAKHKAWVASMPRLPPTSPLLPVAKIPAPTASVSEHNKNAELSNLSAEEPLLKENPGRFVLFPIQDTEVGEPRFHFFLKLCQITMTNHSLYPS